MMMMMMSSVCVCVGSVRVAVAVGQGGETGEIEPRLLVVVIEGNVITTENVDAVIHFSTRTSVR